MMRELGSLAVEFGTPERVEWHLDNWRCGMLAWEGAEGFPEQSALLTSGGSSQHFDDMVAASDLRCAAIVNTIIDDLPATQQAAVHHTYLRAVYRFPRDNLGVLLLEAKVRIGRQLKARGVW